MTRFMHLLGVTACLVVVVSCTNMRQTMKVDRPYKWDIQVEKHYDARGIYVGKSETWMKVKR